MKPRLALTPAIIFVPLLFLTTVANCQRARFTWSVADRYKNSWNAWNENRYSYNASYAQPEGFTLNADASSSSGGGEKIARYIWKLKGITQPSFSMGLTSLAPRVSFTKSIPGVSLTQGEYSLSLMIVTFTGKHNEINQTIQIKDWLIVSIGDSFSSGEGNPDEEGKYELLGADVVSIVKACKGGVGKRLKKEEWACRRCNRSKFAAPALAAERTEASDRHSSVTFLTFACAGARTEHLIDAGYRGIEFTPTTSPDDEPPIPENARIKMLLPPQIESVKDAIGDRTIDVLFVSIGMNDLKFSDLIEDCGSPTIKETIHQLSKIAYLDKISDFTIDKFEMFSNSIISAATFEKLSFDLGDRSCITNKVISRLIGLYGSYDRLASAIKKELKVKEVYFIEYPTNVFQAADGSPSVCECLNLVPNITGITDEEADWLGAMGKGLNAVIAAACQRNGWNNVFGVFERFQGKGYCASSGRYFRRIIESLLIQGNRNGAIHPNRIGHAVVSSLLDRAVELEYKRPPVKRVTVTFKRARTAISPDIHGFSIPVKLDLMIRLKPPEPFRQFSSKKWPLLARSLLDISRFPNRKWFSLNEDSCTFSFDIYESPQPLRIPTEFDIIASVAGVTVVEENIVSKFPGTVLSIPQTKNFTLRAANPFTGLECTVTVRTISNVPHDDPAKLN